MVKESRNKYLAKNTAIFAIGNMGTRLINFFMVPLYTYTLSTTEYGTINTVISICSIIIPLVMCNIGEAVRRYLLDKDSDIYGIQTVELTWFCFGAIVSAVMFCVLKLVPEFKVYAGEMSLYVLGNSFVSTTLDYLRGKEKLGKYTLCSLLQTLMIAGFNILFLVYMHYGIKGYFWSYIISYSVCGGIAFIFGDQHKYFRHLSFNKCLFKEMSEFSITLVPNSIMWWITNSSDRLMVTYLVSAAANGIYSVSYKLPTLMSTLNTILMQAWQYSAIRESDSRDKVEYNNSMFKIYTAAISVVAAGLLLINRPFINIYVAPEYREAWKYSPFLIVGSMFQTLSTFVGTSYYVEKDMKGNLVSATVGAAINICLNLVLIPILGVTGAAVATCVSYISVLVYRIKDTKKYLPLSLDKRLTLKLVVTILVMLVFSFVDNIVGNSILLIGTFMILVFTREFYIGMLKKIKRTILRK